MSEPKPPAAAGPVELELGPNVEMPEPLDYCYEWDGPFGTRKFSAAPHNGMKPARSVPLFSAEQMHDYARACVLAATTECSQHWQAKVTGLEQAAGLLALDRAELRKALRAMLYDDNHDAAKNAARAALADLGA